MLSLPTPVYCIRTGVPKQAVAPTERHTHAKLEYMMAVCIVYTAGSGQPEPPRLVLQVGGIQLCRLGNHAWKAEEVPPT